MTFTLTTTQTTAALQHSPLHLYPTLLPELMSQPWITGVNDQLGDPDRHRRGTLVGVDVGHVYDARSRFTASEPQVGFVMRDGEIEATCSLFTPDEHVRYRHIENTVTPRTPAMRAGFGEKIPRDIYLKWL